MLHLREKVRSVANKELILQQTGNFAKAEQDRIQTQLSQRKTLISRKDDMLQHLQQMQIKAQAKNKGQYEDILTSLIQEVLPDKDDRIVLSNTMKNNRASLEIDILCDGDRLRNVDRDKGGSISNIVAMGLRFIVLARHPNRRVLMLDEADSALRPEYIPAFAAVMHQLSVRLGIQVLYISHHPVNCFMGYGRVLELFKEKGQTHFRTISDEAPLPADYEAPESALRYIRLKNYGPHKNTLIELSPGVNIITGDVDLGKSKLIQSVVDLLDNDGSENRIHDDAQAFEVELGLEEGMSLTWGYQRTGSKKTRYELRDGSGDVIEQSNEGKGLPDWLDSYLAMPAVNGENIHFHSQKKSGYLLSSEFTSIQRAQMLPLGRESRDVLRMIQIFNTRLTESRQDVTRLEKELNRHQNTLAALSLIMDNPMDPAQVQVLCETLLDQHRQVSEMGQNIDILESRKTLSELYAVAVKSLDRVVTVEPTITATVAMVDHLKHYSNLINAQASLEELKKLAPANQEPVLNDLNAISATGAHLGTLRKQAEVLRLLDTLKPAIAVEVTDHTALANTIESIEAAHLSADRIKKERKNTANELNLILAEKKALIEELGGMCPACDQPIGEHSYD